MKGMIKIDCEICKGCSLCIEYCPKSAILLSKKLNNKGYFCAEFEETRGCTGCTTCAVVCPESAIEVYRG